MSIEYAAEGPNFAANRDNRGAFATGAGSEARNIGAQTYIENNFGSKVSQPLSWPIFYDLPDLPNRYQMRESDIAQVRTKLLGSGTAIGITSAGRAIGLKGMGGIGKTVLATALVHDPSLRDAFPDGVVWLTVGRNVPVLAKAAELAFALTRASAGFGSPSEARAQLGQITANKRLLVVLDDIWEQEAVDPFTRFGAGCRLIITTRDVRVLERAQADTHRLDLLEPTAAQAFLAEATGVDSAALPAEADEISRQCGRLPLALAAVGALIRQGTYSWKDALAALQEGAVEELDTSWLPDPGQRNLAVVLKLSVDSLTEEVRACLLDCAVFRDDVDIPELAMMRLWSARVPIERHRKLIAQELFDRSLMQRDEMRRYRIHDLYMDYLRHIAAPLAARHRYLVDLYQGACSDGWSSCPDDGYCIQHIAWHLSEAQQISVLRPLLFDAAWIERKLKIAGLHLLLEDYTLSANDQEVLWLGAALRLSAHVLGANPKLLAGQLCGRLLEEDGSSIAELLQSLRHTKSQDLIPLRNGYLNCPGPLLRIISVGAPVTMVALVDDRRVLSRSNNGTLQLWDLGSGAELQRFEEHGGKVHMRRSPLVTERSVVVLGDRRRALFGSEDGTMRLWDLESGDEPRRFEGHGGPVGPVAVLADGARALSGSEDGTLRLWDLESGAELHRFEGHGSPIGKVVLLGDKRRVLSGSEDGTLRLWDLESGAELRQFKSTGLIPEAAVLGDGRRALFNSDDGTFGLWDLESGAELQRFKGLGFVSVVTVLMDGRRALFGTGDGTLLMWDLESGSELRRFKGHGGYVKTLTVLADGRRAISGSSDGMLRLWDLESGAELRQFDGHGVEAFTVLADGRHAISGSSDGMLRLWDLESGAERQRPERQNDGVTTVVPLADGRRALSGFKDGTLRLWDLESGAALQRFERHGEPIRAVALADERRMLSTSDDKEALRLWDKMNYATLHQLEWDGKSVRAVALDDGRRALSGSSDETLRLWDLASGAELRRFEHGSPVLAVAVLVDGHRALSGSDDGILRLWDLESGDELRRFEGRWVTAAAQLAGGRFMLSNSSDGTLKLQDLETESWQSLEGRSIKTIAVLGDRRRALSGSTDGTLRLWDLESGDELRRFEGGWFTAVLAEGSRLSRSDLDTLLLAKSCGGSSTVVLLADEQRALSSSGRTLRLWDLESGAELRRFEGHHGPVKAVAVLADGRRALSGSDDKTLRLWDLESGAELRRFEGHHGPVGAVAVLAEGRRALSGSDDKTLRLWDLESGDEVAIFIADDSIANLTISSSGHRAVVGDSRGRVIVFPLPR